MNNIEKMLQNHIFIGWDVDGTLLDHPRAASIMVEYIRAHPEKTHYICTFRSHGWQHETLDELVDRHPNFPRHLIKAVLNIPDATFARYWEKARGGWHDPVADAAYMEWKGMICAQYGITVLVDDNPDHVLPGCDRYGVLHIHPDDF